MRWTDGVLILLCLSAGACGSPNTATGPTKLTTSGCLFYGSTLTVGVSSGDVSVVSKNPTDGTLQLNGVPCTGATAAKTTILDVIEITTGPETLVLDYSSGTFGLGTAVKGQGTFLDFGKDPNDQLMIRMGATADTVTFGVAGLNVNTDKHLDINFLTSPSGFTVNMGAGNDTFSAAGDATTGAAFALPVVIHGDEGKDSLKGGNGNDTLWGDDGDDLLNAEASATGGADTYNGGDGNDTLSYASRTNAIVATVGDGLANSGEVGEGDTIADTVEILIGGSGGDTLSGSLDPAKVKVLSGGPGDDLFLQRNPVGPDSHDVLNGGPGSDTLDYSVRMVAVSVTLNGLAANSGATGEADWAKADIENVRGGSGNDVLVGNGNSNIIDGGLGVNALYGSDGADTFVQGTDAVSGSDTIDGGNGVDTVDYSLRTHPLTVALDGVTVSGDPAGPEVDIINTNVENCLGGTGNDSLTGNAAANLLDGSAGDDILIGLAGDDTLRGGQGGETVGDAIDCGVGNDIGVDGESYIACEIMLP